MIQQLRDQFRACMCSQVIHWKNLEHLELLLSKCIGSGDANRLNERLKDEIAIMCIEVRSAQAALDSNEVLDRDIEAVIRETADELNVELPDFGNKPPSRFN